jgi:hypothetical protein
MSARFIALNTWRHVRCVIFLSMWGPASSSLDPLQLLAEIRELQTHLALLSAGPKPSTPDPLMSRTVLRRGSVRAYQAAAKRQRHWRTHKNAFEAPWPIIQAWLDVETHQTSKELLERLQREYPGVYREGQLRSLQRRLKQWRTPDRHETYLESTRESQDLPKH